MRPLLWKALLASLAATALLALWPEDEVSAPMVPAVAQAARRPVAPPVALPVTGPPAAPLPVAVSGPAALLPTRPGDWPAPTPMALASWQGRQEPPQRTAPPGRAAGASAPLVRTAPTFPYQWIGQLDDGTGVQVLLASAQRSFGVRAGDVVDRRWRIDPAAQGGLQASLIDSDVVVALRAAGAATPR